MAEIPILKLAPAALRRRLSEGSRPPGPRQPAQITALELDGVSLRVVQAVRNGTASTVTSILALPLELPAVPDRAPAEPGSPSVPVVAGPDPAVLGQAMGRAMDKARVKPAVAVMGLSRSQVLVRLLTVPLMEDLRELAAIVQLQMARDLPFSAGDAVIDFVVCRTMPAPPPRLAGPGGGEGRSADVPPPLATGPKLEILAVVAQRSVVDFHHRLAAAAGFKLAGLGFLPAAGARCVEACEVTGLPPAFAHVSLKGGDADVDVVSDHVLVFSRSLRQGPSEGSPAVEPPTGHPLAIDVLRTLRSYAGVGPSAPRPGKILVSGSTGLEEVLARRLAADTGLPADALDVGTGLRLPPGSQSQAAGAVAVAGLALGFLDSGALALDFLNPKRPPVERDLRKIRILAAVAAVGCLVLLAAGVRSWLLGKRQKTLNALNQEIAAAEKPRNLYRQTVQQAGVVNEWIRGRRDWLNHYAYLSAVLPASEEVHLTSLAITGPRALRLAVQARSGETLAKVEKQLRAAGYEVRPLSITPGADRNGYEFRSTVELLVPEKLRIDLSKVKPPPRPADDGSLDPVVRRTGS